MVNSLQEWKEKALDQWQNFLATWPIEHLDSMTLEDYSLGLGNKISFCQWIEHKTKDFAESRGGNARKHGIYYSKDENQFYVKKSLPQDPKQAFLIVRDMIVKIAQLARQRDLTALEELENNSDLPFGPIDFRKIVLLYQPINAPFMLPVCSDDLMAEIVGEETSYYEGQAKLQVLRGSKDWWQFSWETIYMSQQANLGISSPRAKELSLMLRILQKRKNLVIQGAPGTGKTYSIPQLVVGLCQPEIDTSDRPSVMKAFKGLVANDRAVFCTFHPSLDYEDFVEGWKPEQTEEDEGMRLRLQDGIFKKICKSAIADNQTITLDSQIPDLSIKPNAQVWKISLQQTGENPLRSDCLKEGRVRIGWDSYGEMLEKIDKKAEGYNQIRRFIEEIKVGDIVISCFSEKTTDAIGVVTGEYEMLPDDGLGYLRSRKVKWLYKGKPISIFELNDNTVMTLSTVYRLFRITPQMVKNLLSSLVEKKAVMHKPQPFVLVIDEINRGNISKIFGELITLLEADKRQQISVKLAYSKDDFFVPSNLYIIGTMNTADRSIGNMDYALRRRFSFVTMKPKKLLNDNFDEELFDAVSHLFVLDPDAETVEPNRQTLSEEFDPLDVWVGHSYFLMQDEGDRLLRYQYEIKPILMEYIRDGVLKEEAAKKEIETFESKLGL